LVTSQKSYVDADDTSFYLISSYKNSLRAIHGRFKVDSVDAGKIYAVFFLILKCFKTFNPATCQNPTIIDSDF
jgi:hypothetical protein